MSHIKIITCKHTMKSFYEINKEPIKSMKNLNQTFKCVCQSTYGSTNFPFGGNHGAISGTHWVHYKPPVLDTLGVGMYATMIWCIKRNVTVGWLMKNGWKFA